MFKKYRIGACMGGAMNSIDWRSTILRWGAVALSLGAWAGVAVLVSQFFG